MIKNYGFMVISILHIEFYSITNLLKDKLLGLNRDRIEIIETDE